MPLCLAFGALLHAMTPKQIASCIESLKAYCYKACSLRLVEKPMVFCWKKNPNNETKKPCSLNLVLVVPRRGRRLFWTASPKEKLKVSFEPLSPFDVPYH